MNNNRGKIDLLCYRRTFSKIAQCSLNIMHMMKPEWIKTGLAAPSVIIALDGMPYSTLAHPNRRNFFKSVRQICKRRKSD